MMNLEWNFESEPIWSHREKSEKMWWNQRLVFFGPFLSLVSPVVPLKGSIIIVNHALYQFVEYNPLCPQTKAEKEVRRFENLFEYCKSLQPLILRY